jgi:hypothetical protein
MDRSPSSAIAAKPGFFHRVALLLAFFAMAGTAFAWNDEGHMAIAYLAYERLNAATRKRVDALLKLNPDYAKWKAAIPVGTSEAEAKRMIFMIAATWPDQIRNDPQYADDGADNGNLPDGAPTSSQNIGYADRLRHKYWHFIDIPYSQDGMPLPPVPSPNIQTQIAAFRAALASRSSDDVKSYDLVWLEHLVGDVHMPLHAVTRVSRDMPKGDAGGNAESLCSAPCRDQLHGFWDRLVGSQRGIQPPQPTATGGPPQVDEAAELRSATSAARSLPAADASLAKEMSEAAWVRESFNAAKQYVYVAPIGAGQGPFAITSDYYEAARAVAERRVALAGARLGNLLNRELK